MLGSRSWGSNPMGGGVWRQRVLETPHEEGNPLLSVHRNTDDRRTWSFTRGARPMLPWSDPVFGASRAQTMSAASFFFPSPVHP